MLIHKSEKEFQLIYADSMIIIAQRSADKLIALQAHITKGLVLFNQNKCGAALEEYLMANRLAVQTDDTYYTYQLKFLMGQTKYYLGYYDEAISLLRECVEQYDTEGGKPYLISLHALGLCYQGVGKLDICSALNKMGIQDARETEDYDMIPFFEQSEGINQYFKKNYRNSIMSLEGLNTSLIKKNDIRNETVRNFYLGKNYIALQQYEKAIGYLAKVDTTFNNNVFIRPELREAYEIMIGHYKSKGDYRSELYLMKQLIKVDRYLFTNFRHLSRKIDKEYNTGKLMAARKEANEATETKRLLQILLFTVSVGALILPLTLFYRNRRNKIKKRKKIEKIINSQSAEENEEEMHVLGINLEIVTAILDNLEKFEASKGFLEKGLTQARLAMILGYNTSYVSKVINHYKECKVMEYINDLRINYIISLLQNERKYRSYTHKALADEVGFGSAQQFVKVFEKKTGVGLGEFLVQI
ncbi:helix-turn-helix domain-containing protein [Flavobacterium sp.]|uniref:helix-turn-helix domain-containing protein n=1 Tax=Flavobacterium sp. TaxID=239 RepID=UPI0039E6FE61